MKLLFKLPQERVLSRDRPYFTTVLLIHRISNNPIVIVNNLNDKFGITSPQALVVSS